MKVDSHNRVIIRVWTSEKNQQFPGQNVGHISIETPERYMSLWPVPFSQAQINEYQKAGTLKQQYLKYFMPRDSHYMRSCREDEQAEGDVKPQVVICLYTLDRKAINMQFERLSQETKSWRLIGSNLLVQKLESVAETLVLHSTTFQSEVGKRQVENCASFALKMLKAGDIQQLVSLSENSSFASNTSSSVSPDQILDILLPAKRAELARYPETESFTFGGETPLAALMSSKTLEDGKSTCSVM